MEYLINAADQTRAKYAEIARFCGLSSGSEEACALALVEKVRAVAMEIGQPATIQACGIEPAAFNAAIPDLIDRALNEVTTMTVSRVPGEEDLDKIFRYAYEGRRIDF